MKLWVVVEAWMQMMMMKMLMMETLPQPAEQLLQSHTVAEAGELLREAPAAWLYHARGVQGVSRRLQGVTMDLRGELATLSEWHVAGSDESP